MSFRRFLQMFRRSQHRDANAVLNVIDVFLADPQVSRSEREALWDVLTALRGPDERGITKDATTAVVRTAAFPRTARAMSSGMLYLLADFAPFRRPPAVLDPVWDLATNDLILTHFGRHYQRAIDALRRLGQLP